MRAKLRCGHTRLHERCAHCLALQAEWYAKLDGFEDAEDTTTAGRPLKAWSGVSLQIIPGDGEECIDLLDMVISQSPNAPYQGGFPESHLSSRERLLHHPDFDDLCDDLCGHGNHKLTATQVKSIWERYVAGGTNRAIAKLLDINDTLVWRTINTLIQWTNLMDLDETAQPLSKVVLRAFKPKTDEAFVYASWRNALWYDDENRREGDSDRFYRQATRSIRTVLENGNTHVRIACLADSPNLIVGYSVISGLCLHFVYVKADYRNKRIGSLLVPRAVENVSPVLTKIGRAIAVKKGFIKQNKENLDGQEKED